MRFASRLSLAAALLFLAACASRQEITRLESDAVRSVCVVEHAAVQTATLDTIKEGLSKRGLSVRVIKGTYENKHSSWIPKFQRAEAAGCDALLFYVANWHWDLAYYMRFANIWMTDATGSRRLAQATYDASRNIGVGKFIVARDKLLELMDQMLAGVNLAAAPATAPVSPPVRTGASVPSNPESDPKARLLQLEDLRKQGVISADEYAAKRKAILDTL